MNILWLSHLLPFPPKGGAAQRSYHLIKQAALRNRVDLIAFNQQAMVSGKENIALSKNAFLEFCKEVTVLDIPSEMHPYGTYMLAAKSLFTKDSYNVNWLKSKKMHEVVKEITNRNQYDIIWFDTISLLPYFKYVKKSKTILNHHNIESDMMIRRAMKERNPFLKAYFLQEGYKLRFAERRNCPRFNLNVTCSKLDLERLLKKNHHLNVAVIPNGVDIDYFKSSGIQSEKQSLVFAGDLSWYPNREAMIYFSSKVWPLLVAKMPDVRMTVIGKKPPEELKRLAETDNRFTVTGFVDDVRPYIEKAAVYVCPIMNGGGTKLKVLDALAMGKAIVAHPIACEGIEVKDGDTVLYATNPEMFVSKIQYLFKNEEQCATIGKQGRLLAEKVYSFEQIGLTMNEEFKRVCSHID